MTSPLFVRTHGMTGTRPYRIWKNMRQRCLNKNRPDYRHYGGRYIVICEEWNTFAGFWKDMKSGYAVGLELDRIDNSKGYNPDNCRWATRKEQVNNTRRCHLITYQGRTLNISQWAAELGVPRSRIKDRIFRLGWTEHEALRANDNELEEIPQLTYETASRGY